MGETSNILTPVNVKQTKKQNKKQLCLYVNIIGIPPDSYMIAISWMLPQNMNKWTGMYLTGEVFGCSSKVSPPMNDYLWNLTMCWYVGQHTIKQHPSKKGKPINKQAKKCCLGNTKE